MLEWTEGRLVSPPGNQRGRNTDFYTLESKHNAGKMRLQPWHPQSGKMEWPEMAAPRQVRAPQHHHTAERPERNVLAVDADVSGGESPSEQEPTEYSQGQHLLAWSEL